MQCALYLHCAQAHPLTVAIKPMLIMCSHGCAGSIKYHQADSASCTGCYLPCQSSSSCWPCKETWEGDPSSPRYRLPACTTLMSLYTQSILHAAIKCTMCKHVQPPTAPNRCTMMQAGKKVWPKRRHLELSKVLGHLALFIHFDNQVKVALGILWRCWRVRPNHKLFAAILIL